MKLSRREVQFIPDHVERNPRQVKLRTFAIIPIASIGIILIPKRFSFCLSVHTLISTFEKIFY